MDGKIDDIYVYIKCKNTDDIKEIVEDLHPIDIVEILTKIGIKDRIYLFSLLPHELAADVLDEADSDMFSEILENLTKEKTTEILDEMSLDDVADILSELSETKQNKYIDMFDAEDATDIRDLMKYSEDTAGGIMTTDYVAIREDMNIKEAIEEIRMSSSDAETIYYVYVISYIGALVGVLSLRDIIMAESNILVSEVMTSNLIHVSTYTDQEEVAKTVSKYDLLAIPVTDEDGVLRGIITVDDILDVVEEEATEDIYKFVGTSENEYDEDDGAIQNLFNSITSRLPWLLITLGGSFVTGSIIQGFQTLIESDGALVTFMPALTGMGGNVGTQASTLTVRGIATGRINSKEILKNLLREASVGLSIGIICGILTSIVAGIFFGRFDLGPIVGIAMMANIVTAASIGTLAPIIFKNIGIDPAVASAPFISTTIDITGNVIYFSLIKLMI